MFGFGQGEIIMLLVVVLLLFGPKNLPRLAQSIGRSARELKNGLQGVGDEVKDAMSEEPTTPRSTSVNNPPAASDVADAEPAEQTDNDQKPTT
jgi:sec-independent protein translocase protein TatA